MSTRFDLPDAKIGDTFIQPFRFKNADGDPIPQAGQIYRFSLSLNPTLDDAATDRYQEQEIDDTPEAEAGAVVFIFHISQTQNLQPAVYNYELKRVQPGDPESLVLTLLHGKVKFTY